MITNERQYRTSRTQLAELRRSLRALEERGTPSADVDALVRAEVEALRSEVELITQQLREYESLKSGTVTSFSASSLDQLPELLIRARIARGLSQRALAHLLGVREQQIQRYEAEAYASASLRRLSEVAAALELDINEVAELRSPVTAESTPAANDINWNSFPIRDMYRRNWFDVLGFKDSLAVACANGAELAEQFVKLAMPRRQLACLKQRIRSGSTMDTYALWAWQCRVILLAGEGPATVKFKRSAMTDIWFRKLVQASRLEDGPAQCRRILSSIGIALVIEPHLPQTYLDGAAFLLPDGSPVVAMTLRYDRLDNFWFVLLHELAHVLKHLRRGVLESIFDDCESTPNAFEEEADRLAQDVLIPTQVWDTALARYLRSEESVRDLAAQLRIHPSIIAGRIRREAGNYALLGDLLGGGEVRRLFPEARFAQ